MSTFRPLSKSRIDAFKTEFKYRFHDTDVPTPKTMLRAREVLQDAKKRLETIGWGKSSYVIKDDNKKVIGYCALGAVNSVTPKNWRMQEVCEKALDTVLTVYGKDNVSECDSIIFFNDACRTKQPVLTVYDRAIKTLEALWPATPKRAKAATKKKKRS